MGVQLTPLLSGKEVELKSLAGKSIAIDAFNWLFQFITVIRLKTGEPLRDRQGRITSHLSGVFYRTANLLEASVKPVYVFDGEPPAFKGETVAEREQARRQAELRVQEALEAGRWEEVRLYAQAAARLSDQMVQDAKELLSAMGIPFVQAPSEGEAQAAAMVLANRVWASASQDWDSLLFGSTRLVRNLSITGKRKLPRKEAYVEIRPELLELDKVLCQLEITREQLIVLGMLVGTDYNPGVGGIGPKTALKLVKEHKTLEGVLKQVEWEGPDPHQIYEFFLNPPVSEDYELCWRAPNKEEVFRIMVEEHDFSRDRVEKVVEILERAHKTPVTSLQRWM